MRRLGSLILMLVASPTVLGSTTICKVDGNSATLPTAVSWDTSTNQAKADFSLYGKKSGTLTLSRPHDDGAKVNLVFPSSDSSLANQFELIVFPVGRNEYRILGVAYSIIDGQKHLTLGLGNETASCSTL